MKIHTPLDEKTVKKLRPGMWVEITGEIFGARDCAHKRLVEMIKKGRKLPFDLKGAIIYYVGPTPASKGKIIGSCGPTTSNRMDVYTPALLENGLKGMIGKGLRSEEVRQAIEKHKAVYFITFGGCGAYLSKFIKKSEIIAFPELGPEALYRFEVSGFPAIVGIDSCGKDIYRMRP
jgi:fumarate hydratase subunit beta